MNQSPDNEYFPKNYQHSRGVFLAGINQAAGQKSIGQWAVPGKKDNDLVVDHVYFQPTEKTETLFVLTSGIHGSETYAGAAVQAMFIKEILPKLDRRATGLFIAHAMNPYGFKHHQRCTEAGVNLNRNFSVSGENYKRRSEVSAQLCERFLERKPVGSLKSSLLQKMTLKDSKPVFDGITMDELIKGTAPGQFERPQDWEFGGFGPEPQTKAFTDKMAELMPKYKKIVVFDLHTGLGDRNRLHLLMDEPGKSVDEKFFAELLKPEADKEFYTFTPPEAEGFYPVHGALNSSFGELATADQQVLALTMEYGTLGHSQEDQLIGLNSFALAHQGHFHGYANPSLAEQIIRENFERSRPQDLHWEKEVIRAARGLFAKIFERL